MKKIKIIFLSIAFLSSFMIFVACNNVKPTKLDAPENISVNATTISWEPINHADYYEVYINGRVFQINNAELTTDMLSTSGKYQITIIAYSNSKNYLQSNESQIFEYDNRQGLNTPLNVEINRQNSTLCWTAVENAQNYVVTINGTPYTISKNVYVTSGQTISVSLSYFQQYYVEGQMNTFTVRAAGTNKNRASNDSSVVYYANTANQQTPQNLSLNKQGNKIYLMFDEIVTATNGYTYFIDNAETGKVVLHSGEDISAEFNEFGDYSIELHANAIYANDGQCFYNNSDSISAVFENIPTFVGQKVQNIDVSKDVLKFDAFAEAEKYQIKITRNVNDEITEVADFEVTKADFTLNNNQIDVSEYTEQFGSYTFEVIAIASGRSNKKYTSTSATQNLRVATILETPTLSFESMGSNLKLTIENVKYAKSVKVYLNNIIEPVLNISNQSAQETLTANLSKSLMVAGNNSFYCQAIGDGDLFYDSAYSAYQTYRISQINVPTNLQINNNNLSFSYTGDYDKFLVFANNNQIGETTSKTYEINILAAGRYQISVSAMYQAEEGAASESVEYIKTAKLAKPTNLNVANNVLSFGAVENATSYDIYLTNADVNNSKIASNIQATSFVLQDNLLSAGSNYFKVLAHGDGEVYLDSDFSDAYNYLQSNEVGNVTNIAFGIENDKYVITFDGTNRADSYSVELITPLTSHTYETTSTKVDVDEYMTKKGTYTINITAKSSNPDFEDTLTSKTESINVLYNKSYYQSQSFFYDGKDYSYVFNDVYSLQDFVFYAVMYGLDEVQVYIDNSNSAFDFENKTLKSYLPCLSNYGVDFSNGNDLYAALEDLLLSMDFAKIEEAVGMIERAHDQIYLYFDIDDSKTKQANANMNANIYTIKITYDSGFKIEATDNHDKPLVGMYDVQMRNDFAIDNLTETAPVETVDQLLMVVQNGRRPTFPVAGTVAETTYNYARNVLSKICNNSMSDPEKAIAIHDWIVRNNLYADDTYDRASGEPFSVDNLDDMAFFASGTLLYHYSVCSGYAQTFALMCNIEGIEAIECFGICGGGLNYSSISFKQSNMGSTAIYLYLNQSKLSNISGHYWNRVKVDIGNGKKWYIVDPTWDDADDENEPLLAEHTYMFVTDNFIKGNRKEFYPNGEIYLTTDDDGDNYSATDTKNYYDYVGTNVESEEELQTVVSRLATQDIIDIKYFETLSKSTVQTAITNAGLNVNNYGICIYSSKYAYIYKK